MLLLLIRHAHAGERDPDRWPDDRDRPLTDKGRKIQRKMSRALGKLDLVPTMVLATETADILVRELGLASPAIPCEPLAASPDFSRLADDIGEPGSGAIVALVGHSPWMEELASLLLADSPAGLRIDFPKSGVMGIDLAQPAPGAGELRFFLRPKMV
jgi:phosphohistidine phosphatase